MTMNAGEAENRNPFHSRNWPPISARGLKHPRVVDGQFTQEGSRSWSLMSAEHSNIPERLASEADNSTFSLQLSLTLDLSEGALHFKIGSAPLSQPSLEMSSQALHKAVSPRLIVDPVQLTKPTITVTFFSPEPFSPCQGSHSSCLLSFLHCLFIYFNLCSTQV